uniref:Uncharacterized protein n=1 Tax=Glossina pallidipes TaxID=7398 RepID=A0A1A9ZIJ6_GLOPL
MHYNNALHGIGWRLRLPPPPPPPSPPPSPQPPSLTSPSSPPPPLPTITTITTTTTTTTTTTLSQPPSSAPLPTLLSSLIYIFVAVSVLALVNRDKTVTGDFLEGESLAEKGDTTLNTTLLSKICCVINRNDYVSCVAYTKGPLELRRKMQTRKPDCYSTINRSYLIYRPIRISVKVMLCYAML